MLASVQDTFDFDLLDSDKEGPSQSILSERPAQLWTADPLHYRKLRQWLLVILRQFRWALTRAGGNVLVLGWLFEVDLSLKV
jgi:hypothetical protein